MALLSSITPTKNLIKHKNFDSIALIMTLFRNAKNYPRNLPFPSKLVYNLHFRFRIAVTPDQI